MNWNRLLLILRNVRNVENVKVHTKTLPSFSLCSREEEKKDNSCLFGLKNFQAPTEFVCFIRMRIFSFLP